MRSLYPWPLFPPNLEPPAARSLSLQLILQEWLTSFKVIGKIQILQNINEMTIELEKLLLFSLENPFTKKAGTLDKLCFYLEELFRTSQVNERDLSISNLDQMRDTILSFRAKMLGWKKTSVYHLIPDNEIEILTHRLRILLIQFYDSLYPFFEEARSDENVLFYLIEHIEPLNEFLSPKKVEQMLACLYPSGPTHLRAILCEGYTRRGFSEFYAKHEALINSIGWTTDTCYATSIKHSH